MPIPQEIRVNPLDLQKNIAIGVSLPFNRPFNSTYTTKDQVKSNLINLILTSRGERIMNPLFGTGLRDFLFEGITENNIQNLRQDLISSIEVFIPQITVSALDIIPNSDFNTVALYINYVVNISQSPDQVIVQIQ